MISIEALKKVIDFRRWPLSIIVALPVMAFVYVHFESHIVYHRIDLGMSGDSLSKRFGTPDRRESSMLFCEKIFQWTGECPEYQHHEYRFFRTGIDRWVVVGLDRDGLVRFKTLGKL